MKKQIVSLLLLVCLAFGLLPALPVGAATSGTCGDNLTWTLDDEGTLTISGSGPMWDRTSVRQAPWYSSRMKIRNIIIEDNVTTIGDYSFCYCDNLTSITIGKGVTIIGECAIFDCRSLTNITIPDSVTAIGVNAFYSCRSLTNVTLGNSVTSIGAFAFDECRKLTSITIPDSVTVIGIRAFNRCRSLTNIDVDKNNTVYCSVDGNLFNKSKTELVEYAIGKADAHYTIPGSVTTICDYAFSYCNNLTSITIPDKVTSIGDCAFMSCYSLTNIVIPDSVTTLSNCVFENCESLTSITIPDKVTSIGDCAFKSCYSLTNIVIPDSVTTIGSFAFGGCDMSSIVISDNVTSFGYSTFSNCDSLTNVTIGDNVTTIYGSVFYDCNSLTTVSIGKSVTAILDGAFESCNNLTNIVIPESVTRIGDSAFISCSSLANIYYGGTEADWEAIKIGSYNGALSNAAIHFKPTIGSSTSNITSQAPAYSTEQQKILQDLQIDTEAMLENIECGNHPIKGPSVTFLGETFYLFEFDGKLNLNFDGVPISVTVDGDLKAIRFLFGFKDYNGHVDMGAAYNDSTYWSQSYQQVKSMYQDITGKKVDTTKLWNQFSSVRGKLKKLNADLIVDASCSVAGYMELSYETGNVKFSEGGILLEAGIGGEFSAAVPSFPVAYVCMGLSATIDGAISVAYEKYISLRSELNADLTANVGVGLQALSKKIAYIEGGLKGTLGANMHVATGKFKAEYASTSPLILTVEGNIYLKGALLGFEAEEKNWPIGEPVQLYPKNEASLMGVELYGGETIEDVIANATPLSRAYLYDAALMAIDDSDKLYSDASLYSYNAPVLTSLSDGNLLLLWVDDLGTKNDVNKTSLMYRIYNGEVWSEAEALFETGVYNGAPAIYYDGVSVHIIWSKAKTAFGDSAGLEDLIVDTELNYTCYANGEFSEPVVLTDNGLLEINYDIIENNGRIAVAWSENTENNPYMTSGTNSLYIREHKDGVWGEKQLIKQSENAIDEVELYYADGAVNCAYTLVASGNITNIYNNSELVGAGNYLNYYDGKLYYLSGNQIVMHDIATATTSETGLTGVNNFTIQEGNAYALVSDGFACELYESINIGGVFSEWEQVTEFNKYVRDYSVTTDAVGEPVYALNLVEVTENESIYGASELAVCKATDINALEVAAVYYDNADVAPAASLPLQIDITNVGTTDISSLTVQITDGEGVALSGGTVDAAIAAGETTTIVYNYTLPSELTLHDITVTVTSSENERNLDNNSVKTSVGYADILVQEVAVERTETGAAAMGRIDNEGYTAATNVVLSIYDASYPDEILKAIDCGDIAPGESYDFTFDIPEKYLTLADKMTMYGLCFQAESDSAELDYANNAEKVVFGELTDYTVAFVDGNQLLNIVSADEFDSYSPVKAGYTLEGWYENVSFHADCKVTAVPADISEHMILFANWIPMSVDTAEYVNHSVNVSATIAEELLSKSGTVMLALYQNDTLVSLHSADIASTVEYTFTDLADAEGYRVKLLCWNGLSDLMPLCDAVGKEVQ